METRINQEVEQLVAKVTELNGESFFPDPVLTVSVMNVIGTILFGQRFHDLDKERDGFSNDIYRSRDAICKRIILTYAQFSCTKLVR